ncbi:hypothetical protein AMECASPLE_009795 [Ameca splendens]|uniref:Uncharacterized protein n=1 Tax=Ameca splendens TaxID=208324 RepID=A0ABV0ZAT9_9TELE
MSTFFPPQRPQRSSTRIVTFTKLLLRWPEQRPSEKTAEEEMAHFLVTTPAAWSYPKTFTPGQASSPPGPPGVRPASMPPISKTAPAIRSH